MLLKNRQITCLNYQLVHQFISQKYKDKKGAKPSKTLCVTGISGTLDYTALFTSVIINSYNRILRKETLFPQISVKDYNSRSDIPSLIFTTNKLRNKTHNLLRRDSCLSFESSTKNPYQWEVQNIQQTPTLQENYLMATESVDRDVLSLDENRGELSLNENRGELSLHEKKYQFTIRLTRFLGIEFEFEYDFKPHGDLILSDLEKQVQELHKSCFGWEMRPKDLEECGVIEPHYFDIYFNQEDEVFAGQPEPDSQEDSNNRIWKWLDPEYQTPQEWFSHLLEL